MISCALCHYGPAVLVQSERRSNQRVNQIKQRSTHSAISRKEMMLASLALDVVLLARVDSEVATVVLQSFSGQSVVALAISLDCLGLDVVLLERVKFEVVALAMSLDGIALAVVLL